MVFGANQTVSLWCRANNTGIDSPRKLRALFWTNPNDTRVPRVDNGELSNYDVYRERYPVDKDNYTDPWWAALHFNRTKPDYAGNYSCIANYNNDFKSGSVEVQVSGE